MFIPQLICTFCYVVGSYFLTGNYTENHRFYLFTLMCLLCTISAQAWGFFIGSTLPIKVSFNQSIRRLLRLLIDKIIFLRFRLLSSSDPFWLFYFLCSASVRVTLTSIKCSSGCGTLAISGLVFTAF